MCACRISLCDRIRRHCRNYNYNLMRRFNRAERTLQLVTGLLGRELTGVDVLTEIGKVRAALRDFVEVRGGRDLFVHLVVSREARLGEHFQ